MPSTNKTLDITDEAEDDVKTTTDTSASQVASEPSTPFASNSIWGSFTGSFFEPQSPESATSDNSGDSSQSISKQPDTTASSLHESFSLIKQRSSTVGAKNKHTTKLSKSFDQPHPNKKSGGNKHDASSGRKVSREDASEDVCVTNKDKIKNIEDDVTHQDKLKESENSPIESQDTVNTKEKGKLVESQDKEEKVKLVRQDEHNVKTEEHIDVKSKKSNQHSFDRKHVPDESSKLRSNVKTVDKDNQSSKDVENTSHSRDNISESSSKLGKLDSASSSRSEIKTGMNKKTHQETTRTDLSKSGSEKSKQTKTRSDETMEETSKSEDQIANLEDVMDNAMPTRKTSQLIETYRDRTNTPATDGEIKDKDKTNTVLTDEEIKDKDKTNKIDTDIDKTKEVTSSNNQSAHGDDSESSNSNLKSETVESKHVKIVESKAKHASIEESSHSEPSNIPAQEPSSILEVLKGSSQEPSSIQKGLITSQEELVPFQKDLTPSQEDLVPFQEDLTPSQKDLTPSQGQSSIQEDPGSSDTVSSQPSPSEGIHIPNEVPAADKDKKDSSPPSQTPVPVKPTPTGAGGGEIILRRKATSESEREKRTSYRVSSSSAGNGNNRLSTISHDSSSRLSSESASVEIMPSPEDSNSASRSLSTSSSVARIPQSASLDELTSPSVEIISETSSSGDKQPSRSSESVEVLQAGDEREEEEGEGEDISLDNDIEEGDDSYQSMSESTQTLTTAMNVMLKSTSSLETSFTDMGSSRENISLPRSLHLSLTQFTPQSQSSPLTQSTSHSHSTQGDTPLTQSTSHSHSTITEADTSLTQSGSHSHSTQSSGQVETQIVQDKEKEGGTVEGNASSLLSKSSHQADSSQGVEGVMDGSASTLVASSDDGTFVHVRDSSPVSSERCEFIRIGSSHTSGDEMDTNTTSSSIEIISSPNGEGSSSTNTSRQSPAKLAPASRGPGGGGSSSRYKGGLGGSSGSRPHHIPELLQGGGGGGGSGTVMTHRRAPSETSSEDTETDKLQKKISEMTEILEARELKLLTLSKQHGDLNETNSNLKVENENMIRMNQEFTHRLATLEKQYQQAMKEKENLRRQVEATKLAASKQHSDEDKDEIIGQLRSEGAALSKQQLALTTSLRKLRASEKENNRTLDTLRGELDQRTSDLERLQKLVQAKEEVERTQIEAVNQLSKTNSRLERDVSSLQQQLDTLTTTLIESQKELHARTVALTDLERRLEENEVSVENKLRHQLEQEIAQETERRQTVERSLQHLRDSLLTAEHQHTQREEKLRQENLTLMRRLEDSQLRNEHLSDSMISATKPLAQQIESLSQTHAQASEAWDVQERNLNQTINELQSRLSSLKNIERTSKEQSIAAAAKISALESKLETEHRDVLRLREQLQQLNEDIEKLSSEKESVLQAKDAQIVSLTQDLAESRRCCIGLEQQLSVERAAVESEKRRIVSLQDQMQGYHQQVSSVPVSHPMPEGQQDHTTPPGFLSHSQRSSPLSLGRAGSVTDSVFPPSEDGDAHAHNTSLNKSVYDSLRHGGSTSLIESLQSQVKLKDTEVQHLQWELSRRDLERVSLQETVTNLSARLEELERSMAGHSELQTQYDALLQMYGEKLEECQELRLDLDDVKEMYKAQIDQLLKKDESG
uniref:TATA element modulatory factor n=1 Tax=Cacopsylla melanoneura TaxID=428564 RepID=A0A8D9DSZ9_9HEMI